MPRPMRREELTAAVQDILREDSPQSLFTAVSHGMNKIVERILLSGKVSANTLNADCASPLHVAAISGLVDTCRLLHSFGAEVNALWEGSTPMHLAASESQSEVVSVLVALGGSMNVYDSLGFTPLHIVAIRGNRPLAMYLIQAGADPTLKDGDGKTVAERWNFASQIPSLHHEEQQASTDDAGSASPRVPDVRCAVTEPALMKVFRSFDSFTDEKRVEPITPEHYAMKHYYWVDLAEISRYLKTHVDDCGLPPSVMEKKILKLLEPAHKQAKSRGDDKLSFEDFSLLWLKAQTSGLL
ncbi:ankyrin repeat protein, putative [Bodo saltans]|uniref:Ankyrin repeat protein, putative n=1 Tax=Bodo saltans TaxID=75058 RepID=A0A0S4IW50_BODSA|nr:ankyrin repeat protein, putative [Bodo saltans]|eukprot:CUF25368.1 ankyrin repeat protein, putative [Bodo saltans]